MNRIKVETWADIERKGWDSLLLGNGASVALHSAFAYRALYDVAQNDSLLQLTEGVFRSLGTTDFEHVLLACWYAKHVNDALASRSEMIVEAYDEVRTALIRAVHAVHPQHASVIADLQRVGMFASQFKTVVSLNYDLTLYWAMLLYNSKHGLWFKDGFIDGEFRSDWKFMQSPREGVEGVTMVFYQHGNLVIARDYYGNESKLSVDDSAGLLDTITRGWMSGALVPVFVSEGSSQQKVTAIRRSYYLTNVYENVLSSIGDNLIVYGWSFDDKDRHVLAAISERPPKRLAVSVYTGQNDGDQQAYCHHVLRATKSQLPRTEVRFFDSQSPGCWNNP